MGEDWQDDCTRDYNWDVHQREVQCVCRYFQSLLFCRLSSEEQGASMSKTVIDQIDSIRPTMKTPVLRIRFFDSFYSIL